MDFYGIDSQGEIKIQRLNVLPAWTPSDKGRIIYVDDGRKLYYGTDIGWNLTTTSGFNAIFINSDYTAEPQDMILYDTADGSFNITLPANPKVGTQICFIDVTGYSEVNPLNVLRNGNTIQKFPKDLIIDIADVYLTLTFEKELISGWKVDIGGVSQVVGNTTLMVNRSVLIAEFDNQTVFTVPFIYNANHDNISIFIGGKKLLPEEYSKTGPSTFRLKTGVAKGTKVDVSSIPLDPAYNLDSFVTPEEIKLYVSKKELLNEIKKVDGAGSGLDADLLDGMHAKDFVYLTNYKDIDVLDKIKNVDGAGSGLDADLLDGFQTSNTSKQFVVPVTGADGKLNFNFLPFGPGMIETLQTLDVAVNSLTVDIKDLDTSPGHIILFENVDLSQDLFSTHLYLKIYNETDGTWDSINYWTTEYSDHDLGPMREFNINTDAVIARDVSVLGICGYGFLNNFSKTEINKQANFELNIRYLSNTVKYASNYRITGYMLPGKSYSGLRLYTSQTVFHSGRIIVGRPVINI